MWLFFQETTDDFAAGGVSKDLLKSFTASMEKGLNPKELFSQLTAIEDKVMDLQKEMGSGLVLSGDAFKIKLQDIYIRVSEVGLSFKDVTDVALGLSKNVGRIIEPSETVIEQMALLGKNIGVTSEAMGGMVGEFMKLTFSQEKSINLIDQITERARKAGVNVKATLEAVSKNLSKVDAYGFKNGVDGLTKMTIQAQQLRTSVEDIGAIQMGQTFWDPEKAIEVAAGMSMLGGAIGNLSNPFQLMNMGANNVEKLQESLVDLSASAFKVNEANGEIETNFVAQQRLKQQLEVLGKGGDYEKYINLGREAAKQKQIIADINKSGLGDMFGTTGSQLTEEDKRLIASLSEVKDGKISLKIPGQEGITDLKEALKDPAGLKQALTEYQDKAAMSEKDIAEKSLSTTDTISKDLKIIGQNLLRSLGASREDTLKLLGTKAKEGVAGSKTMVASQTESAIQNITKISFNPNEEGNMSEKEWDEILKKSGNKPTNEEKEDSLFTGGSKKQFFNEGEVFNFIDNDQALFAPDIDKNLDTLKQSFLQMKKLAPVLQTEVNLGPLGLKMPEIKLPDFSKFEKMFSVKEEKKESKETVQKIEGSGTVNINVNISSSGDLASSLMSDRRFRNDLEKEILDTIKNKDLLMVKK